MFHSSMDKSGKLKQFIIEHLQLPEKDCKIRLVFASVALGMGADLKSVARVIHAGPPLNLETYVQEIGRAGRNRSQAEAVLFFNRNNTGAPSMQKEMKDYCSNSSDCR